MEYFYRARKFLTDLNRAVEVLENIEKNKNNEKYIKFMLNELIEKKKS